ncbi:MAG: M3 family metallopeptidase [Dehalococcoidia bacterium]
MTDYGSMTPEMVVQECEAAMGRCDDAIAAIVRTPDGERTFANTLVAVESAVDHIEQASGTYGFMAYVAADDGLRETARDWDEKIRKYGVELAFREDLYEAVRAFSESGEAASLAGEERRLLEFTMRDYRRNGFGLPVEQRQRVRAIMNRLVELGTQFRKAIDTWDDAIVVTREGLAGLPERFIGGLKTVEEGGVTTYRVSLAYPELYPFLSNAESPELRRELFLKDQTKGGRDNIAVLEEAIALRTEAAKLLGYDSWAAYVVDKRMAKRRENVEGFLADLEPKLRVKFASDMEQLSAAKERQTGDGQVNMWDWRYCQNLLLKHDYAVDEFEVAQYFPLDACIRGLFDVTQQLLGIRYEPAPDAPVWHEDVQAFDIYEAEGKSPFARFYMDLHPRPNKFGHAAAFTLRRGRELPDGTYQQPASAIVANFTKPTAENPSLLRHSEAVTFFHEFGHILHQTLTRARYLEFSGSATERDFVEAPSQMLEHWVWDPEVLGRFTSHYQTGEPLPAALLGSMIRAKNVASGVAMLRQLFFARLDLAFHSPGFGGDTTKTLRELHAITGFPYTEGTHFHSGFGHLFGYDAGYYGYLWSRVFGDDMFTRFEASGVFDGATGRAYRRAILERGGAVDGDELVRSFLGREPNSDAFLRGLGLET